MNLEKLYKMQEELDNHILENAKSRNIIMSEEELLDKTILALLVEVGELANATRCFKHWSTKGSESKERLLDELADIWHFYLSVGNQTEFYINDKTLPNEQEYEYLVEGDTIPEQIFTAIYNIVSGLGITVSPQYNCYEDAGICIYILGRFLGFTDEEVEQAYMKKNEENYRRQAEGY